MASGTDPRTPVIVGVGQTQRHPTTVEELVDSLDLMVEAVRLAAEDSGVGDVLLKQAQSVRVVESLSWRTADPGALIADRLGISPAESIVTATGGNSPQMLVNATASAIQRGELDVAIIAGAEAMYSRRVARKVGERAPSASQPEGTTPATVLGENKFGSHEAELARGLTAPIQVYPVFENAVRAARGRTVQEHQTAITSLWSRFSEVAAANPHAWSREPMSAERLATVDDDNRWVGFPYTKYLNANMQVDQGAALILCSLETARAAGVSDDKLVFPQSGADGFDHWFVSERDNLHSSPAIRLCGEAALRLAGRSIDEMKYVDLYSCFPVAVEIGAQELGLSIDRQLTLTGGLTFGGGPGNNYVTHSIAQLVGKLRGDPGALGLVNANGWYVTKHAVGVYGTEPPAEGFRAEKVQAAIDQLPKREVVAQHEGPVTVESYTVLHGREGEPESAPIACLLSDGKRAWGTTTDAGLMGALKTEELIGRAGTMRPDGTVTIQ